METPTNPGLLQHWTKQIEKLPLPVRIVLGIWIIVSVALHLGAPAVTESLPPFARYLIMLPMALGSLGIAFFLLWSGCSTLFRAWKSVAGTGAGRASSLSPIQSLIGGLGALNIYLLACSWIVFVAMQSFGGRLIGIGLSLLLIGGLAFALFRRGPHPGDVKVFFWGALGLTSFLALLFILVAPPQ